jgi:hypothetical protein
LVLICSNRKVLLVGCWFILRENYWLVTDKPNEQGYVDTQKRLRISAQPRRDALTKWVRKLKATQNLIHVLCSNSRTDHQVNSLSSLKQNLEACVFACCNITKLSNQCRWEWL